MFHLHKALGRLVASLCRDDSLSESHGRYFTLLIHGSHFRAAAAPAHAGPLRLDCGIQLQCLAGHHMDFFLIQLNEFHLHISSCLFNGYTAGSAGFSGSGCDGSVSFLQSRHKSGLVHGGILFHKGFPHHLVSGILRLNCCDELQRLPHLHFSSLHIESNFFGRNRLRRFRPKLSHLCRLFHDAAGHSNLRATRLRGRVVSRGNRNSCRATFSGCGTDSQPVTLHIFNGHAPFVGGLKRQLYCLDSTFLGSGKSDAGVEQFQTLGVRNRNCSRDFKFVAGIKRHQRRCKNRKSR